MTIPPFTWLPTGDDLEDDALCRWEGMLLRYERLDDKCWWWAVSEGRREIASSNDLPGCPGRTHHAARLLAEGAALKEWVRRQP